jgi:hypothetical protein
MGLHSLADARCHRPEDGRHRPRERVCLLEVPVSRTSTSFSKPADPIMGEAVALWEKVRPQEVKLPDEKTGEQVDFLFLIRLTPVGAYYLNDTFIPALFKKARGDH